jgi:hypothetical protein
LAGLLATRRRDDAIIISQNAAIECASHRHVVDPRQHRLMEINEALSRALRLAADNFGVCHNRSSQQATNKDWVNTTCSGKEQRGLARFRRAAKSDRWVVSHFGLRDSVLRWLSDIATFWRCHLDLNVTPAIDVVEKEICISRHDRAGGRRG